MAICKSKFVLMFLVLCFASIQFPDSQCLAAQAQTTKQNDSFETNSFQGKVVSNSGPVADATAYLFGTSLVAESATDTEGKFRFDVGSDQPAKILVVAPGMVSQLRSFDPSKKTAISIRLKEQKSQLKGRIIDSQGMGVADANLQLMVYGQGESMNPIPPGLEISHLRSTSDSKGWFEFPGFEASSIGQIKVTGTGIVPATINSESFKNTTNDIVLIAQPARSVVGSVVDRISKLPLTHIHVASRRGANAKVDESGKFELKGLPAFEPLVLIATPTGDKPYHSLGVSVPVVQGFEPSKVDIELEPGVWVKCNVKDFVTNEPASAQMYYIPTQENEQFRSFAESFQTRGGLPSQPTDKSGNANLVAVPGPGVVAIVARGFPPDESVSKLTDQQRGFLLQVAGSELTSVQWIEPKNLEDEIEVNFVVSQGRAIEVELKGKKFASTDQFVVHRAASKTSYAQNIQGPKFAAEQFHPGETRQVLIHNVQQGLGAVLDLKAEAKSPVSVTLNPTGALVGQLLDKNAEPQPGLLVKFEIETDDGFEEIATQIFTDANGRFEKPSLISGLNYRISAVRPTKNQQMMMKASPAVDSRWFIAEELKINGSEVVDLGAIELGAEKQPEPKRAARKESVASDNSLPSLIGGVVTTETGEPVANATVTFNTWPNRSGDLKKDIGLEPTVLAQAITDAGGSFQMSIDGSLEESIVTDADGAKNAAIVVVAKKLGAIQIPLADLSEPGKLNLKMNREMVIRGRLIATGDQDTQKISLTAGAPIRVYDAETLEKVVSSLKNGGSLKSVEQEFKPFSELDPLRGGPPLIWKTSSSGAFLVQNVPLNGIFELHALSETGQRKTILVVSRPMRGFDFKPDGSSETMQLQGSRVKLVFGSTESGEN